MDETKILLLKFAAFMRKHVDSKAKADDAEIVDDFIDTLNSVGDAVCTHCGSSEVKEADFKDAPRNAGEPASRGPAYLCKCGYWTHRKVGIVTTSGLR